MKKERTYENAIVEVTLYNGKDDTLHTEIFLPISDEELEEAMKKILLPGESIDDFNYFWSVYNVDSLNDFILFDFYGEGNDLYLLMDLVDDINSFSRYECKEFAAISAAYGGPSSVDDLGEMVVDINKGNYSFREDEDLEDIAREMIEYGDFPEKNESNISEVADYLRDDWTETGFGVISYKY